MTDSFRGLTPEAIASLLADTSPYLSCDECFAQIDEYVERLRADPAHHNAPMRAHLANCGVCAEEAETLTELLCHDAS